ncbi:hypothetical protein BGZ91_000523 [Linnemannia elongata]|nr:hypothetical protein BGZ91_000523 [Linnemannia elongata]KAG0078920.1 hypothetical protein BGZ90_004035 [Linnemannia elongata]
MKTFRSFTVAFAMMVALTIALIAGPVDALNRWQCAEACAKEYEKCPASAKPTCDRELAMCISDCDG